MFTSNMCITLALRDSPIPILSQISTILSSNKAVGIKKLIYGKGLKRGKRMSDIKKIQLRNLKLSQLIMGLRKIF